MKVFIDHIKVEAPHIYTYYLRPESPVAFQAGQHALFTFQHNNQDDWGDSRWFTISSSPSEDLLSITVKFVESQGSTYTQALRRANPSDALEMGQPQGDFILPEDQSIPLVFVAGGIGIAPYHSMFQWIKTTNQHRDIKLLYAVSDVKDIIFHDMIDELNPNARLYSEQLPPSSQSEGRKLSSEDVLNIADVEPSSRIFISGPKHMVNELYNDLLELRVTPSRIVRDAF